MEFNLTRCVWEITLACCFSCKYCGSSGGKARADELTTAECISVADQLADLGCRRVSLIGGEVFMRRDWHDIALHLSELGINVNTITNGFIITDELLGKLKSAHVESVSVSIDGPMAVHDKYRQAGSYERAVKAVKALTAAGIPVSVITTLNSENINCLEEFLETVKTFDIYAWQLQACSPMGNAANGGIDVAFDPNKAIDFVTMHMHEVPFALGVADNIGYFTDEEGSIRGNMSGNAFFRGCLAGISAVGIDSVGNVRGCESMYDPRFTEGNLREQTLREIWESPDNFLYNRAFTPELLTGKCAECEMGKYCGGGCRSYNYFVHGKLYESPRCARN